MCVGESCLLIVEIPPYIAAINYCVLTIWFYTHVDSNSATTPLNIELVYKQIVAI